MTTAEIRTNTSKAISVIGSILRAGREGDRKVRRSIQGWLAFLTGGGFAVYAAVRLLSLAEDQIRSGWRLQAAQQVAVVEALKEVAQNMKATNDKLDRMTDVMAAMREASSTEHAILIDRVKRVSR